MRSLRLSNWLRLIPLLSLLFVSLAGGVAPPDGRADKIEPGLRQQAAREPQVTAWVLLREKADLSRASAARDWRARGQAVVDELQAVANASQAGLRGLLRSRGIAHRPFWIVNALQVRADAALLDELAQRPEVAQLRADRSYEIPRPQVEKEQHVNAVEWNIARIQAPDVWSTFGVRGEGIVVANIDTGVQFDHPALVRQYRGNQGDGSFDHNYNWFDPSNICGFPSLVPCDNNGHGTHTMGTMVGEDESALNQIGVAPGATWIAAKGCEYSSCTLEALLGSGEWVLAPTDLNGQNPRPDLRPHLVNNSWGGWGGDPFFQSVVQSWVAAGIFPVFANGNSGSSCSTAGSPADYPESYAVGASDSWDMIAWFSSRGPSAMDGSTKPNITAPGVDVRSSVPGNGYDWFSGTSMAAPHLAGTVALMWSAAPSLSGDIAATRELLDVTAADVEDLSCGGTAGNNNVWGEGLLNAFAAVDQAPRGPTGTLQGLVTDAGSGAPLAGARVAITGPSSRIVHSASSGSYSTRLPVGLYEVSASAFGYQSQSTSGVEVTAGGVTLQDFGLQAAPRYSLSGVVRDQDGNALAGARISLLGTPIAPATSDSSGAYRFSDVPAGTYDVRAEQGGCSMPQTQPLVLEQDQTLDFALQRRVDSFGYFCSLPAPAYIEASTPLGLSGDEYAVSIGLPFAFPFYGQTYTSATVSTNGVVSFVGDSAPSWRQGAIPDPWFPNAAAYVFWDDLDLDWESSTWTELRGAAPDRQFIIEWRNATFWGDWQRRIDFQVVLHENGELLMQYRNIDPDRREQGDSATIGLEDEQGSVAFQYSFLQQAIASPSFAIHYQLPPSGFIAGQVLDANDQQPVAGAHVEALQQGAVVRQASTDANGRYRIQVPVGDYLVQATAMHYQGASAAVSVLEDQTVPQDFVLATARAELSPQQVTFLVPVGQTRTRTLTLRNTGGLDLVWQISQAGDQPPPDPYPPYPYPGPTPTPTPTLTPPSSWLAANPASGTLAPGGSQSIDLTASTAGLQPGVYNTTLVVESNSGRQPRLQLPVSLIVTAYMQGLNAGGGDYTDLAGELWAADRAYSAGSFGYINTRARSGSTRSDIAGTDDDPLFQAVRQDPTEYRFDGLPGGVYEVELLFAEIQKRQPGTRLFDVIAEGSMVLPAHDITYEVGNFSADRHSFFIAISDGQLNLRLVERRGYAAPIISGMRVTHRPDR